MPPGAYAGHQMIELEWKALTEAAAAIQFGLDEIQRNRIMVRELGRGARVVALAARDRAVGHCSQFGVNMG